MKKKKKINSVIGRDEFMEANNFWFYILPACLAVVFTISMFLAKAFSALGLIGAETVFFGTSIFNAVDEIFKKINIKEIHKLEKKARFIENRFDTFKSNEVNKDTKKDPEKPLQENLNKNIQLKKL